MTMLRSSIRRMPSLRRMRMIAWSRAVSKSRARPPPVTSSRSSMNSPDRVLGRPLTAAYLFSPSVYGLGAAALVLQEVEHLDEVALLGVRSALAVLQVVLPEEPVQQGGVSDLEVSRDPVRGHPLVQAFHRVGVGGDCFFSKGRPSRLFTVWR